MKTILTVLLLSVTNWVFGAEIFGNVQTGYVDQRTTVQVSKAILNKFEMGGISLAKDGFGEKLSCHYLKLRVGICHEGWQLLFTNINYQKLNTFTDYTPLRADFLMEASYQVKGFRVGVAHRCNHEVNNYPEIDRCAAFGGYNRIFLEWNFNFKI